MSAKRIHLHFFIGGSDFYIAEFDGHDTFWGFVILNHDYQMAEWGYISFRELKSIKAYGWLEVDCEHEDFFPIRKAREIEKIRKAHGWNKKEEDDSDVNPYQQEEAHEQGTA